MLAESLRVVAEDLARLDAQNRPRQASLRRAVSTGYYAMFHLWARAASERMFANPDERRRFAVLAARDFTHSRLNDLAKEVVKPPGSRKAEVRGIVGAEPFAQLGRVCETFTEALQQREDADYNHGATFKRSEVNRLLRDVRNAFDTWNAAPAAERDLFLVLLMMRGRGQGRAV
jgi:uncharacterized protein (UPF0332 family)